jgi:hypothetical protein
MSERTGTQQGYVGIVGINGADMQRGNGRCRMLGKTNGISVAHNGL